MISIPIKDPEKRRQYLRDYRKKHPTYEKDNCPNCSELKSKRRNLCQSCFLKGLHKNEQRNKKISKLLKNRTPWNKGETKQTHSSIKSISERHKGKQNPMWVGDEVTYHALHQWVARHKPKPELCEECDENEPYDLANISQEYLRDVNDFEWLCRKCHMKKDGRLEKLIQR